MVEFTARCSSMKLSIFPLQAVQPLVHVAAEVLDLLVQVPELQAHRGQVGLDDPELAGVLSRDLFEAPGQGSGLAVSNGALRHPCQTTNRRQEDSTTTRPLSPVIAGSADPRANRVITFS
ncbi:hypothetical protein ACFY15_36165 [Streptomyces sp. NPDC001373]|uniref:hypothetical protein n=1 Tax=Streptomyces sp. NPDC001373 TaxID=3364565 RepID=UPI0036744938